MQRLRFYEFGTCVFKLDFFYISQKVFDPVNDFPLESH